MTNVFSLEAEVKFREYVPTIHAFFNLKIGTF